MAGQNASQVGALSTPLFWMATYRRDLNIRVAGLSSDFTLFPSDADLCEDSSKDTSSRHSRNTMIGARERY